MKSAARAESRASAVCLEFCVSCKKQVSSDRRGAHRSRGARSNGLRFGAANAACIASDASRGGRRSRQTSPVESSTSEDNAGWNLRLGRSKWVKRREARHSPERRQLRAPVAARSTRSGSLTKWIARYPSDASGAPTRPSNGGAASLSAVSTEAALTSVAVGVCATRCARFARCGQHLTARIDRGVSPRWRRDTETFRARASPFANPEG